MKNNKIMILPIRNPSPLISQLVLYPALPKENLELLNSTNFGKVPPPPSLLYEVGIHTMAQQWNLLGT